MTNLKYSVGIDVSKKDFEACLALIDQIQHVSIKARTSFDNSKAGFSQFDRWIEKHKKEALPITFTMEATGVYYEQLAWFLYTNNYRISVLLPNKAKKYMQSLGLKSKNDRIDAKGLARMGAEQHLDPWEPMSKDLYVLRSLTRHLEHLQHTRTSLNNQLEAYQHGMYDLKEVTKGIKATIRVIDKQIEKVKKQIEDIVAKSNVLSKKIKHMTSIKGIGLHTAVVLLAETNGFALIKNQRQLVSYSGYDVVENSSGSRVGKTKISKKGNAHIRRALHFPAFNVVRYEVSGLDGLYARVYERSKIKMKAYVAVQKKLLCLIYALWKNDKDFNPDMASDNQEPKPLFQVGPIGPENEVATPRMATQDGLPCNRSPEALFQVIQI